MRECDIHVYLDTKLYFFHITTLMEKEAEIKNDSEDIYVFAVRQKTGWERDDLLAFVCDV